MKYASLILIAGLCLFTVPMPVQSHDQRSLSECFISEQVSKTELAMIAEAFYAPSYLGVQRDFVELVSDESKGACLIGLTSMQDGATRCFGSKLEVGEVVKQDLVWSAGP